MLTDYFRRVGARRFAFVAVGNVVLGMGIALFRLSNLGCDPFSAMNIEISKFLPISYGTFQLAVNLMLFAVQVTFARELIGVGTVINACLLAYINSFFYSLFSAAFGGGFPMGVRLALAAAAVVVCSFGLSLYQTPNAGVAPYDALAIILNRRMPKVSYFWWRMLTDVTCALLCALAGGIATGNLGVGTLICAFCFGPIIQFFDRVFTRRHVTPL